MRPSCSAPTVPVLLVFFELDVALAGEVAASLVASSGHVVRAMTPAEMTMAAAMTVAASAAGADYPEGNSSS